MSEAATGQRAGSAYLRLILLAALIGIPAALAAALLVAVVNTLEDWLWKDLPTVLGFAAPPWFLIVGLPTLGALIVVLARRLLPGDGGHPPLGGLSATPTPPSWAPGVIVAAIGTLAFGAVLGPELPVVALGSIVGVGLLRFARLDERETKVLSTAGAFSAISALFGGPLVAGILLIEAGLGAGAALVPALLPGLVAAAVGYLIFVGFGDWGGLNAPGLVVPDLPVYSGLHAGDLLVSVAVGVLAVLAIGGARQIGTRLDGLRPRLGMPLLLLGGGVSVGLLALLAQALGDNSQDVLFSGQSSLADVVGTSQLSLLLILLVTKLIAYGVCLGCGFRGGPIFPAIFAGVAIAAIAVVVLDVSPTLAIAIGAAAGMAAETRLLFAPLLFSTLLVGPAGAAALPAAVAATVSAWLTLAFIGARGPFRRASTQG